MVQFVRILLATKICISILLTHACILEKLNYITEHQALDMEITKNEMIFKASFWRGCFKIQITISKTHVCPTDRGGTVASSRHTNPFK